MTNPYCDAMRIGVPVLEKVKDHPEANTYSLLIVALLERGDAMTPEEVVAFVGARSRWHGVKLDSAKFRRPRSTIRVRDDGRWEIGDDREALLAARKAVRSVLKALGVDAGDRRLAELGPPQKSKILNRRGRTLRITTAMLIQGSCGIARPFGEDDALERYLREGRSTKLRRRLEADAKSLLHYYEYGRLHGAVRLRWGFLDEMIPAPWVHRDELCFHDLKRRALERGQVLEVVTGSAPGWAEPWARARYCHVEREPSGYGLLLVDDEGFEVDDRDVQLARLAAMKGGVGPT